MKTILLFGVAAILSAQTAHYRHDGAALLPDSRVTPGTATNATAAELCNPKFHTASVRHVTEAEKRLACREYGVSPCDRHVEIDHLISLELGGSNDIRNLWPEPYQPAPGARTKDVLENRLHRMVCGGQMSLKDAQRVIAGDWYAAYRKYVGE